MGKKLNKKNIVMDINAGYSVNDIAEYVGVSEKTLLAFMKKNNIKTKKPTINSLKNRLKGSSKPLKKNFGWFYGFKEFFEPIWEDIKTIPSWFKTTVTNKEFIVLSIKEFIVLSIFGLVLGSVIIGIGYSIIVLFNYYVLS